jgi:uncharacterized repeat protein (TIGR03803 family)
LRTQKTCVPTGAGVRSSHRGASQNAAVWANLGAGKAPARFVCWVWRLQLPRLHRLSPPWWISTLQTVLNPWFMSFVQDTDGNFYGTKSRGGTNTWGTILQITPGGARKTLYRLRAIQLPRRRSPHRGINSSCRWRLLPDNLLWRGRFEGLRLWLRRLSRV